MQSAHIQGLTLASCLQDTGGPWGLESAFPQASLCAQTASGAQGWSQDKEQGRGSPAEGPAGAGSALTRLSLCRIASEFSLGRLGTLVCFPTNCLLLS